MAEHIAQLEGVDVAEILGMKHAIYDEGILAFVCLQKGVDLTAEQTMEQKKLQPTNGLNLECWPHTQGGYSCRKYAENHVL